MDKQTPIVGPVKWNSAKQGLKDALEISREKFDAVTNILAIGGGTSDCGRCRLMERFLELRNYAKFIQPEVPTELLAEYTGKLLYAKDITKRLGISLTEVNFEMLAFAGPTIKTWSEQWEKYMAGLRTHNIDEAKFRLAMDGLYAVIRNLRWKQDAMRKAQSVSPETMDGNSLIKLEAYYKDNCPRPKPKPDTPTLEGQQSASSLASPSSSSSQ